MEDRHTKRHKKSPKRKVKMAQYDAVRFERLEIISKKERVATSSCNAVFDATHLLTSLPSYLRLGGKNLHIYYINL